MALVPTNVVERARSQAQQFYRGFTPGQKAVTIAAVVAAVIGGIVVMSMTGKPSYAPLFTNLQPSDAASITAKLSSAKIPYQLTDGGTTVMVPAGDVNQERVALAQAGLPNSSTVGLSLLDKEGLTTSSMSQQADYLQAIQGELEQTIDSISGVQSSQVNVALPANQDFALSNDTPTGASVLVTMQSGQELSDGDVSAIVHLVSSSVPNLSSSDVTVADSTGDLLAGPGVTAGADGSGSDSSGYDATTAAKIQAYLASVVGAGNSDVQVNATLDYNQVSTTTNSILAGPNGQPTSFCTQTSDTDETYDGTGAPTGSGTAGTIVSSTSSGTGNYKNTSTDQTCETSEQTQTVQQAPGTLKSQQVAVLVNSRAIPQGVNLTALQAGVAAAAGIQPSRGDQLAFSTMPFNQTEANQAAAAAKAAAAASKSKATSSLIRTAVVFFIILLVLFLIWRSAKKARIAPTVLSPADIEALRATRQLNATSVLPVVSLPEVAPPVEQMTINHFIDNQPEDVANMLRSWLQDSPSKVQA